ncbi:CRISPR system precrRNA processing endoribonuclease RAMP protein Cas6 [Brachyspira pulli]|uniref:CRISPR system precrRNA processing endoribonuclease RAMP protein Cas6 n=1 Tax=Brachyspira pulli TaxID=310721 RepID=UPI003007C587
MLATLLIKIKPRDNAVIKKDYGSLFHGYLLSKLDTNYVEKLHHLALNPYSQYSYFDSNDNTYIWKISTLNKEAKDKIIDIIFNDKDESLVITYHNLKADIISKEIVNVCSYKDIADRYFLSTDSAKTVNIKFLTPTTYKIHRNYTIFPYMNNMFISLYDKWNYYSENISLEDSKLIPDIEKYVKIIKYNLRSTKFSMEGVGIDSFMGEIKLYCSGPNMFVNIYNMLLDFAIYSGIGAKTSLSMGGVSISRPYIEKMKNNSHSNK